MPRQSTLTEGMRKTRASFLRIAGSIDRLAPVLQAPPAPTVSAAGAKERPARKKPRITTESRSALKLQGQYMGTMRGLPPRQKARVNRERF